MVLFAELLVHVACVYTHVRTRTHTHTLAWAWVSPQGREGGPLTCLLGHFSHPRDRGPPHPPASFSFTPSSALGATPSPPRFHPHRAQGCAAHGHVSTSSAAWSPGCLRGPRSCCASNPALPSASLSPCVFTSLCVCPHPGSRSIHVSSFPWLASPSPSPAFLPLPLDEPTTVHGRCLLGTKALTG